MKVKFSATEPSQCLNCAYYEPIEKQGLCKRYPPSFARLEGFQRMDGFYVYEVSSHHFPFVHSSSCCGEWKKAEKK